MKDKKTHHSAVDNHSSEQQFCKSDEVTKISGAMHLAQVGLMPGWQSGSQIKYR